MAASIHGRLDVVESLIQAGADVDKAVVDGTTALIAASREGHAAIVKALIQAGADIDKANNNGATALIAASGKGHDAIVEVLLQAGADVNRATINGTTALIIRQKDNKNQRETTIIRYVERGDEVEDESTAVDGSGKPVSHSRIYTTLRVVRLEKDLGTGAVIESENTYKRRRK